ncbi:hypothetical protein [Gayadomonas joobiniege]|uniref:hypothetical protein n=1 Tax=Gayadomonas joobiniege TaxID=1234606 RepID=UPI0003809F37|nr:hypothetical protein [Gayadomonas joobiniege]
MEKYKYVVTTGWWCPENKMDDTRAELIGDDKLRTKDFFKLWLQGVVKYTSPKKILIVDSASPIKPDAFLDPRIELVSLDCNAGHATNHIGKYAGVTRAHVMGMVYALTCEVDYWVYIEQDALIYGDGIVERCIDEMKGGIMFGHGEGTPQPMQQSLMIMKTDLIPSFLEKLTNIQSIDNLITPEMKFAMCTSKIAMSLPEAFFYEAQNISKGNIILTKIGRKLIRKLMNYDSLPIGYGRKRPIDFSDKHFYFQHGCDEELKEYLALMDKN